MESLYKQAKLLNFNSFGAGRLFGLLFFVFVMKTFIFMLIFLCISLNKIHAQQYDNTWVIAGVHAWDTINFLENLKCKLTFNENETTKDTSESIDFQSFFNGVSFSDSIGSLRYFSNGCNILDTDFKEIIGSDSLWFPYSSYAMCTNFNTGVDNPNPLGFIVQSPVSDSIAFFFHRYYRWIVDFPGYEIVPFMTKIVHKKDGSNFVFPKVKLLDGIYQGISANKHANGRDWWIIIPSIDYSKYTRFLLTGDSLIGPFDQVFSDFKIDQPLNGRGVFSPNGLSYVQFMYGRGIALYDFDRCTGLLSNRKLTLFDFCGSDPAIPNSSAGGVAFSPNSQFLYFAYSSYKCLNGFPVLPLTESNLIQYDLALNSFPSNGDTVGVDDKYRYYTFQSEGIGFAQLAPNGKLYFSNSGPSMHVIDFPNRKGKNCNFRQRGFELPLITSPYSLPYFPNYRLGPVDGSSCDTLGLNNIPLADWHWSIEDVNDNHSITFTDNSSYEPQNWHWDFGDAQVSNDTSPVHQYAQSGTYHVCLTISNQNGSNTKCRDVDIAVLKSDEVLELLDLTISPNPASNKVSILLEGNVKSQLRLTNLLGQILTTQTFTGKQTELSVASLPAGIVFVQILERGKVKAVGKLVIVR
jgi:PKD domain/Secretion system C-terminal sorting domain